ncbi:MAG: lactate utilization protein [Deltaproteobacteria bacterium]|nr:lactate utilization protein [Deltaproteobacteria bacterium]MBT8373311.1 lactate utilization protein [Deltaproteobacteria bacterium]
MQIDRYWEVRLKNCKTALEKNNFDAFIAETLSDVKKIVIDQILPGIDIQSVSWGDSLTLYSTGILEYFRDKSGIELIETFGENISREKSMERRREAILTDLFFTGTNAVIESGILVNLDMIGNRVGGITFGPKNVIIVVGRNKIVQKLDDAMNRIKNTAAPANAIRHAKNTPCVKTSYCMNCKSPDRICNIWTIHEKSYPKGRIKVILINQDLGL